MNLKENIENYYEQKKIQTPMLKIDNSNLIKINDIKQRLSRLSEDIIQSQVGEIVPDIEVKKQEFRTLHNEIRVLEGKPPREVSKTK